MVGTGLLLFWHNYFQIVLCGKVCKISLIETFTGGQFAGADDTMRKAAMMMSTVVSVMCHMQEYKINIDMNIKIHETTEISIDKRRSPSTMNKFTFLMLMI